MLRKRALHRRASQALIVAVTVALGGSISVAQTSPAPESASPGSHAEGPKVEYVSGTVGSYNLSPGGLPDALMIQADGKTIQVNCPPPLAAALSQVAPVGEQVKITAVSERSRSDHPVYRLLALTNSKGQSLGAARSASPQTIHVDGAVKQLNYGRGGELNGALLESGDLVRLTPEAAAQLKLAVGQKLTIDGTQRPMMLGHNLIDAQTVNGFAIVPPGAAEEGPGGPPEEPRRPGQGARRGGPGEGGPRERPRDRGNEGPGPEGTRGEGGPPPPPGQDRGPETSRPHGPPRDRQGRPGDRGGAGGPDGPDRARGHRPPPPEDEQGPGGPREGGPRERHAGPPDREEGNDGPQGADHRRGNRPPPPDGGQDGPRGGDRQAGDRPPPPDGAQDGPRGGDRRAGNRPPPPDGGQGGPQGGDGPGGHRPPPPGDRPAPGDAPPPR